MNYRKLKPGEIIKDTDEYIPARSMHSTNTGYIPVNICSVGKSILECNVKYYRRPINSKGNQGEYVK